MREIEYRRALRDALQGDREGFQAALRHAIRTGRRWEQIALLRAADDYGLAEQPDWGAMIEADPRQPPTWLGIELCWGYGNMYRVGADILEPALEIFEDAYPDDPAPRAAVDGARQYADGEITRQEFQRLLETAAKSHFVAWDDIVEDDDPASISADIAAAASSFLPPISGIGEHTSTSLETIAQFISNAMGEEGVLEARDRPAHLSTPRPDGLEGPGEEAGRQIWILRSYLLGRKGVC